MLKTVDSGSYQPRAAFMNQIRDVSYLDPSLGYNVQDIDCSIYNYKTKRILFNELKCNGRLPSFAETQHLLFISESMAYNPSFLGVALIQHDNLGCVNDKTHIYLLLNKEWKPIWNKTADGNTLVFTNDDMFRWIERSLKTVDK